MKSSNDIVKANNAPEIITAIGISKSKPILRKIVLQVNNLPIMNPDIAP